MKKLIFILLECLVLTAHAQGVTTNPSDRVFLECTYKFSFRFDNTNNHTEVEYTILSISKKYSRFASRGTLLVDSLLAYAQTLPFTQANGDMISQKFSRIPRSNFSYDIYKDHNTSLVYYYDTIGAQSYRYTEQAQLFDWTITQSKSIIAGYECQKATTKWRGRVFEAWFIADS